MAVSGNTSFAFTTEQIVTKAYRLLGVLGVADSLSGEDYSTGLDTLNMMVKSWQAEGIYVFTEAYGTIFPTVAQGVYKLGSGSTDHCAIDPVVETQLTATEAAAGTTLAVNSTTGMTVGDIIGVLQDSGTVFWTTIATIPTSTTLTLTSGITSTATEHAYIYSYTTTAGRPISIDNVVVRKTGGTDSTLAPSTSEFRLREISREVYQNIPNKYITGTPVQYYVDAQSTYTNLRLYPTPSSSAWRIKFSYKRVIDDFTNTTDNPDFPQEWVACLCYNLAVWLAPEIGKELKVGGQSAGTAGIGIRAADLLAKAQASAQECTPIRIAPNIPDYD